MPEPIAYVYRQARDHDGRVDLLALGNLIPKDLVKESMEGDRIIYIHQPPASEIPPGILIFMDGEQEMHPGDTVKSTPAILEDLYENKKIIPVVSVYIPASADRISEYACNNDFANFLNHKLVPLLREPPFYCGDSREQTIIAGTSFGGLAATHAALTYPETFGNVLSQSGAYWWNEEWAGFDHPDKWATASKKAEHETTRQAIAMEWLSKIPHKENLPINFYLIGGEIEEDKTPSLDSESFPGAITLNKGLSIRLIERGHSVTAEIRNGDHDYGSWQADKPIALQTLLPMPTPQLAADHEITKQYRGDIREIKQPGSGKLSPESSELEIAPLPLTPKPPWST